MEMQLIKICGCNVSNVQRKFRALNSYIKKEERPKINYLSLHHGKLDKKEQIKFKEENKQ